MLKSFLGKIDNCYNAYLWFQVRGIVRDNEVLKTSPNFKTKKVKHGFLITYRAESPTGPEGAAADLTYFIGNDFKTLFISARHLRFRQKGDVIYKF